MTTDHGRAIFDRGRKEQRGKPKGAKGVSANHDPLKPSKWAVAEPGAPRDNTPLLKAGVPGVPAVEALPVRAPTGRSIFSPEQYLDRKVPAGETLYAAKHAKPKQEKRGDKVHDRHGELHGKVRSGRHPAAPLKSELTGKPATKEEGGDDA